MGADTDRGRHSALTAAQNRVECRGTMVWLDAPGLAWVREHLPGARIKRHRRLVIYFRGRRELRDEEAVVLPPRGLTKTRKAGFRPREVLVETVCGVCQRAYVPQYEHDPCIAALPGIRYACCGHGAGDGYLYFNNGIVVRFAGPQSIERHLDDGQTDAPKPDDARFWSRIAAAGDLQGEGAHDA